MNASCLSEYGLQSSGSDDSANWRKPILVSGAFGKSKPSFGKTLPFDRRCFIANSFVCRNI